MSSLLLNMLYFVSMKIFIALLSFSLVGSSLTVEEVASRVQEKLRSIRSFQARFHQIYYPSSVSTPLEEKGKFYFQKPDWMRWEYTEPEEKIFLYKEGTFLFYFPEDKEVIQSSESKERYESEILSLLSGQKHLMDDYTIELSPFPSINKKQWQLKLTPREENEYTHILLEVDEKTWLILKAIFFDWAGSKSEFHFTQIKIDMRLSQKTFELNLPPDVEIIKDKSYKKQDDFPRNP